MLNISSPSIHLQMIACNHIIFLLIFSAILTFSSCQKSTPSYRILVVQSFEQDNPAYNDSERLILKNFQKEQINVELKILYLNCEQYGSNAEEGFMYLQLDTFSKWKPNLILVYDDQATYSLMACKHPLASSIPVVFGGVNFPNEEKLQEYPNVSGFWDKLDFITNIRLIEHCLGKSGVYLLQDSTFIDRHIKEMIFNQCSDSGMPIINNEFVSYKEHSLEEYQVIMQRPDSTTVFILPIQGDKLANVSWHMSKYRPHYYYLQAKKDFRVINISRFTNKPSFAAINEDLGYDSKLIGGYLTSLETQIKETVHQAAEILKGKPIESFPQITESEKGYVFDFKEVEFWGINKDLLPPDSTYLNYPFVKAHPILAWGLIITFIGSIIFLFLRILLLYIKEAKAKRQAQYDLLQEKESLAHALEKANESDHMKSVFLANMSHEIRTPLNAIVGFSSLILEEELTKEERQQYSEIITTNNDLLLKLVNDVLDLARLESGHIALQIHPYNLTTLINTLYETYLPEIPQCVAFRKNFPESPIHLQTDPDRLYQVLENILKNAIKFTSTGFIEIGYKHLIEEQEVCLYVQDTGIGISQEDQTLIFERFKKLNDFVQGTGLGLSICHAITQRLNGCINIDSHIGQGSRFSISFKI